MKLIYDNLETAVREPHNKKARENMSLGQYLAGLSLEALVLDLSMRWRISLEQVIILRMGCATQFCSPW